jgi:hypothetical protein
MEHGRGTPGDGAGVTQIASPCACVAAAPPSVVTPTVVQKDQGKAADALATATIPAPLARAFDERGLLAWQDSSPPTFGRLRVHALIGVWQI